MTGLIQHIEVGVLRREVNDGVAVNARVIAQDGRTCFDCERWLPSTTYGDNQIMREQALQHIERLCASEAIQSLLYWVQHGCPAAKPQPQEIPK